MAFSLRCLSVLLRGCRRYNTATDKDLVGFIGLGNMGGPMARNLLAKGRPLLVYDVEASAVEGAVAAGAAKADSPAEVASRARTVVTMLPAGAHVLSCYTGEAGLLGAVQPGSLLIDSSTVHPAMAQEVAARAEEAGASFLDAPVSGGTGSAQKGMLAFMVGGSRESCDLATPLLRCMGRAVLHCGPHGAGQTAKICNNMLLGISMIGTSEALQLGINLGLDPKVLSEVINSASGRCWSSDVYNPCPGVMEGVPSSNNYSGGFGTPLMTKDLNLAMEAAEGSRSLTPLGAMATQIYRIMCQKGYADKDFSSVFKFLEKE